VSRAHDRFEALAGALALGEATPAERAQFADHARICALCAEDAEALPATLAFVDAARRSERWQPSLSGELDERLRSRRETRSRRTFATLGLGIVASLALNVLFVSGVAGRALDALRVAPDTAPVSGTRLTLEHRPPRASLAGAAAPAPRRSAQAVRERHSPAAPEVVAGLALAPADSATLSREKRCAATSESLDAGREPCPASPAGALFR
jgi:hypothetical protein